MARTKWLKIRVSDQEIADIKKRAGQHDMSNYVRGLVLDQPVAAPFSPMSTALISAESTHGKTCKTSSMVLPTPMIPPTSD